MTVAKWAKLDWQDPFLLEQQLTDEECMVRDTAHQYAQVIQLLNCSLGPQGPQQHLRKNYKPLAYY